MSDGPDHPASVDALPEGVVGLRSPTLELVVAPGSGGRIISLRHRPRNLELLWQQQPVVAWPRYGVPESDADVQGWDECCPAIGPGSFPPGPWEGVHNPAQGEVYALPWQVVRRSANAIEMTVHGLRFPYQLRRTITLDEATIRLHYVMENHGACAFPFIWSAHPLFTAPRGGQIALPSDVQSALVDSSLAGRLGSAYDTVEWPLTRPSNGLLSDLTQVVPGSGWGDKLYLTALSTGACALHRAEGLTLTLSWKVEDLPYLGIWIDTVGEGQARVALEPCLGYPDLMAVAAERGRHATLAPLSEMEWSWTLRVIDRIQVNMGASPQGRTNTIEDGT